MTTNPGSLDDAQRDRALGAILGMACGDALGAPYEFNPPVGPDAEVAMTGSSMWEVGEWTDDTSMAIPLLQQLALGRDLRDDVTLDAVVAAWEGWAAEAKDVGVQTSRVLRGVGGSVADARIAAYLLHEREGQSGGNGSLMRTAPVALAYLDDADAMVHAARLVSGVTHFERDAGDACVLWCVAIRHAVLTGELDVRQGLDYLEADAAARWATLIDEADAKQPWDFPKNGWVVQAFQGAWSAIVHATDAAGHARVGEGAPPAAVLADALDGAVRGGFDTDTVAAISGSLVGAACGASAVPGEWRAVLHGWPGKDGEWLVGLAGRAVTRV